MREEFEHVYANDAEKAIGDMLFGKDDEDEVENGQGWSELKLKVLRNYNLKLDVRESRKRFVLQHGLLDWRKLQELRRRMEQRESTKLSSDVMASELESLTRFSSLEQHTHLQQGIVRERLIRDEIRKLQQYRAMGIRTYDEIDAYNQLAARRHSSLVQRQQQRGEAMDAPPPKRLDMDKFNSDPEIHSLTAEELKLSEDWLMTPTQFMVFKECILGEAMRNGGCVSTNQVKALLSVELTFVETLLDFFVRCQWVKRTE